MEHPTEFNVLATDTHIFVRRGFEYDVPDGFWYLCTYAYRKAVLIDIYAKREIVEKVITDALDAFAYHGPSLNLFKSEPAQPKIEDFRPDFGCTKFQDKAYQLSTSRTKGE